MLDPKRAESDLVSILVGAVLVCHLQPYPFRILDLADYLGLSELGPLDRQILLRDSETIFAGLTEHHPCDSVLVEPNLEGQLLREVARIPACKAERERDRGLRLADDRLAGVASVAQMASLVGLLSNLKVYRPRLRAEGLAAALEVIELRAPAVTLAGSHRRHSKAIRERNSVSWPANR